MCTWQKLQAHTLFGNQLWTQQRTNQCSAILQCSTLNSCLGSTIFQQDGAPSHPTNTVTEYLERKLRHRWIIRRGPINWPARSPDLTPLDFFLWKYVKDKVILVRILSVEHLQSRITRAIRSVYSDTLSNLWKNISARINCIVRQLGKHIEQITF